MNFSLSFIDEEINNYYEEAMCFHSFFEPWQTHKNNFLNRARGDSRRHAVTVAFIALKKDN